MISAKTILALIFILAPLVASLLEQRKRKDKADEAMREIKRRQGRGPRSGAPNAPATPPEAPRPKQTLADWIEEVRQSALDDEEERVETPPETPARAERPRRSSREGGRPVLRERDLIETIEEPTVTPSDPTPEMLAAEHKASAAAARNREATAGSAYARRERPSVAADESESSERDAAPEATRARRAQLEGEGRARFTLNLKRSELARALVLHEVLGPPLALREDAEI